LLVVLGNIRAMQHGRWNSFLADDRLTKTAATIYNNRLAPPHRPPANGDAILEFQFLKAGAYYLVKAHLISDDIKQCLVRHFGENRMPIGDELVGSEGMSILEEFRGAKVGRSKVRPANPSIEERVNETDFDQVLET
jgi:hypothetical protein